MGVAGTCRFTLPAEVNPPRVVLLIKDGLHERELAVEKNKVTLTAGQVIDIACLPRGGFDLVVETD